MLDSIYDRYDIFLKIYKLLNKTFDKNDLQCLIPFQNKKNLYSINKKIILKKRIGQDSVYGTIFLSLIKPLKYKFITKVQLFDKTGKNELQILSLIRDYALKSKNFHLPLFIKNFNCNSYDIFDSRLPPNIVGKYFYSYSSTTAELAHGTVREYIEVIFKGNKNDISRKIINLIKQCILSVMTLHYLGFSHNDAHLRNFLFFNVKKTDGYYKYNYKGKSFYLENTGVVCVIWDFGKSKPLDKINMLDDFKQVVRLFKRYIKDYSLKYGVILNQTMNDFIYTLMYNYDMYLNNDLIIEKLFFNKEVSKGKLLGTIDLF
jgi:hypothetical protein